MSGSWPAVERFHHVLGKQPMASSILATTVIFWGFEFGFDHLFATKEMRYLGGILGLAIGYLSKYFLDKRYVFRDLSA